MTPFTVLESRVIVLDRAHVDTDQIIPKQFLKTTERTGLRRGLFFAWRQQPDFVLNRPAAKGAHILIAGENFGCGSSREHAAWALLDFGIRCVIAPSFADIFYNNACKNGLLPVKLPINSLRSAASLRVNLAAQTVTSADATLHFEIDIFRKRCLLEGLDDIALTLQHEAAIRQFEEVHS